LESIVFLNKNGESINFGLEIGLISVDGLGDVEAENQTQKAPFQDGTTFINSLLGERVITIEFIIEGKNYKEVMNKRSLLSRVTNPKLGLGVLRYQSYGVREINAVASMVPAFPDGSNNRGSTYQKGMISFLCPDPYWLETEQIDQLVVWEGGLEFPLDLPTSFASLSQNKSKLLYNGGAEEAPIQIVFNGPATAPIRITNITTGKYLEVNQSLDVGESLEINTAFGKKRVEKVLVNGSKQNAFHYIAIPGSDFFGLSVGNNLIDYVTGADYEQAGVTIIWRERFLSV
jgi:hypothetical protein